MAQSQTEKLAARLASRGSTSIKLSNPSDRAEYDRAKAALRRAAVSIGAGSTYVTEKRGSKVTAFV